MPCLATRGSKKPHPFTKSYFENYKRWRIFHFSFTKQKSISPLTHSHFSHRQSRRLRRFLKIQKQRSYPKNKRGKERKKEVRVLFSCPFPVSFFENYISLGSTKMDDPGGDLVQSPTDPSL